MHIDDPYRELGLTEEASDSEVKAAWRRLSARWHPDRNPSPQALHRIQRINTALDAIRSARDRAQTTAADAAAAPAEPRDEALHHTITLSLEEAACGLTRTVQGEVTRPCTTCAGSGEAPEPVACAQCDGRGHAASLWFPWLAPPVRCTACGGRGTCSAPCPACEGAGHGAPRAYRTRLRIPPGVRDGHALHARVKLKPGAGQKAADVPLDVRVQLQPHPFMSLQDDGTVRVEVPVDGFAWIAGRWVDVPTPHGLRQMRLQRGALNYRIKDAGFPASVSGARADCMVSVVPLFPEQWGEHQQALIDALIQTSTADASTEAGAKLQAWQRQVDAWHDAQHASQTG